ncbi:CBM9 family sugar-binding protein [Winogradskyella poriferorum]|uniref:CBM9 family sugar-binding protein n=1 Tax=Winogradskyella poriferorum TaxID=307627 RepID=A0ABU7W4A5_9FLAO
MKKYIVILLMALCFSSCKNTNKEIIETTPKSTKPEKQLRQILKAKNAIKIDGIADETSWKNAKWHPMDQVWLGDSLTAEDFSGRFKLTWDDEALYVLAQIKDDTLIDNIKDPLVKWWDEDCLEIFVDEDNSGGEHQYNHNAFAYHIALDGNVVDMSTEKIGKLYNSHIESKLVTSDNTSIWEVKMYLYNDTYDDNSKPNKPVKLTTNKKVGFAIAYCDNDYSTERENFIGSIPVEGEDKNRGWMDANIFGTLKLKD